MNRVRTAIDALQLAKIQPVINGTGIVYSPTSAAHPRPCANRIAHRDRVWLHNLEYNLTGGERGHRAAYLEHNLAPALRGRKPPW